MTEETNVTDISGNGNHANSGALRFTFGPTGDPNGALYASGQPGQLPWLRWARAKGLDFGKHPGFSFCGFASLVTKRSPLLVFAGGFHIFSTPALYVSGFPGPFDQAFHKLTFNLGVWQFFGVSYERATGKLLAFMDGSAEEVIAPKHFVVHTTSYMNIGFRKSDAALHGGLSCLMMFKTALTAHQFKGVRKVCLKRARQINKDDPKNWYGLFKKGHKIKAPNQISESVKPSYKRCLSECNNNDNCWSFSFTPSSGKCIISGVDFYREDVATEADLESTLYSLYINIVN